MVVVQVSFGQMIACENDECEIEWFHFECVGLTEQVRALLTAVSLCRVRLLTTTLWAVLCGRVTCLCGSAGRQVVLPSLLGGQDGLMDHDRGETARPAAHLHHRRTC